MDPIHFDKLPDLCLRKIFAFLGLRDLVRCRAVNRLLKSYADSTQVTELVVYGERRYGRCYEKARNWYQTDRPIDLESAITVDAFKCVKSSPFKLNQQLKFLHLIVWGDSYLPLRAVGNLKQLIHFEFRSRADSPEKARTLTLPNLKVFAIESRDRVILNAPKLEVLKCVMSQIHLEYPETIKRLEYLKDDRYHGGRYDFKKELTKLSGLEALHVHLEYNAHNPLDGIRLSDFPDLKELNIKCSLGYRDGYEQLRSLLLNFMHDRSALLRDELKLYLNDVLLLSDDQLLIFDPQDQDRNAFEFMNYRLLLGHSYPDVDSVNFNLLMRLDFEISEDFFERFPRIQKLTATNRVDPEQLEWFLQNATALSSLKLTETRLDQAFFDRLPKHCSRLTRLEFYESSDLVTNFQFLLQFEHLEVFETDRPLHSFDLAAAAFRQLEKLERLLYRTGNALVKIRRPSTLEDNYTLRFLRDEREGESIKTSEIFCQVNLSWARLADLYEQRRAGLNIMSEKRMRIKRLKISI